MHKDDIKKISQKAKHLLNDGLTLSQTYILSDPERNKDLNHIFANAPNDAIIIYRNYGQRLPEINKKYKKRLLATIDAKNAIKANIYGIHIPNRFLNKYRISNATSLYKTASAHNIKEILKAKSCGIENIIISPIFPSQSKSAVKIMGKIKLLGLINQFPRLRFIALGGINNKTLNRLKGVKLYGIAGVSFK